jgi:hypothetical protein
MNIFLFQQSAYTYYASVKHEYRAIIGVRACVQMVQNAMMALIQRSVGDWVGDWICAHRAWLWPGRDV